MRKAKGAGGLGATLNDDESRAIIYEGCSLSQLASLFGLDNRVIAGKISKVAPCGERMGYPIYKVVDVAPYLVPPKKRDITDAIKRMSPRDLPPSLTKEFWLAQQARVDFEENQADLWRTGDVVEVLGEVFKTSRMSLLLMRDQVERQVELSDKQRDVIQALIDAVLNDMSNSLVKKFQNDHRRPGSQQWEDPDEDEEAEEDEPL